MKIIIKTMSYINGKDRNDTTKSPHDDTTMLMIDKIFPWNK
jgi:hypothetical protein